MQFREVQELSTVISNTTQTGYSSNTTGAGGNTTTGGKFGFGADSFGLGEE